MPTHPSHLGARLASQLRDSRAYQGIRSATLVLLGCVAAWLLYFGFKTVTFPYPLEYREGGSQVTTQFLLNGENPFTLENQPLGANDYGIGYALAVLPLAAIFGNTLLVHRAVSTFFVLLSSILVFRTIFKSGGGAIPSVMGAEISFMALAAL